MIDQKHGGTPTNDINNQCEVVIPSMKSPVKLKDHIKSCAYKLSVHEIELKKKKKKNDRIL